MRHSIRHKSTAAAAAIGASALLLVGCGSRDVGETRAQAFANGNAAAPMAVSCEPNQRALVRPVVINGATVSQVECVSGQYAAAPVAPAYQTGVPAAMPVSYAQAAPVQYPPLENTRVVPVQQYPARTAAPQRVSYQRAPERAVRQTRSVKKSAIIIGSSAAGGAGLGALLGGKKGAAIGAIVGGGGATVWDQMTRRKN